jgi:hypothetical protein
MRHFCTLFDRNYISRGLALHGSLLRHCGDFTLHVLCLDAPTFQALAALALPRTKLISIESLEAEHSDLRRARSDRTLVEFYFTCKPVLLQDVLDRNPDVTRVDYLDSDLYFFSGPSPLEREYAGSAVALSPHRFSALNASRTQYGNFNAGWVSVSADKEGRRFIAWWRARCMEWCRMEVEEKRFGDQKYLDQVPALFARTSVVSHPGVNLGPWNIGDCRIDLSERGVEVSGGPLVFFHFHGTKRLVLNLYESGMQHYGAGLTPAIRRGIYRPYVTELAACERALSSLPATIRPGMNASRTCSPADLARQFLSTARAVARHSTVFAAA